MVFFSQKNRVIIFYLLKHGDILIEFSVTNNFVNIKEIYVLFLKFLFYNRNLCFFPEIYVLLQKFMFYVLKSSDVLDVLVPILYFLNDARADQCKWDVIPGVFLSSYMYMYFKQLFYTEWFTWRRVV